MKLETGEALKPETAACGMKLETGEALKPETSALRPET
jgi:hypothetical protein